MLKESKKEVGSVAEDDELDAWECRECFGRGYIETEEACDHHTLDGEYMGTEWVPVQHTCGACVGVGYCGPDAEARAALSKAGASQ